MSSQDKLDYVLEHFDSWEEVIARDIHFATTHKVALLAAFEQKRYNKFTPLYKFLRKKYRTGLSVV